MKEELQGKLLEILTSMQTAAGKAQDFALEQLPEIAQSYVAYGRVSTTVFLVIAVLMLASVIPFGKLLNKAFKDDDPAIGIPAMFGCACSVAGGLILALTNLNSAMLVWFAPKVWLLKEIATLVK